MEYLRVMRQRHSVRQYRDDPIPDGIRDALSREVARQNALGGLHMQLLFDEPTCFDSLIAHYGRFVGVRDYLAIVGPKGPDLQECAGYYGERIVLLAQSLGLNSCWVGMTHGRSRATVAAGEKLAILIALGYGKTDGVAHHSKPMSELCQVDGGIPDWFRLGMEAAMLSPTAVNQQKFIISYKEHALTADISGAGFFTHVDLGIVKNDFELASGHAFAKLGTSAR